ncbi:MAG TPA: hypothetical protein PKW98_11450 [Candidatus Wallbacteria bacterium]|nr:MAG: hypothetical protein BWY32_02259 [bacterium ADurb.Bin243]HOD38944.1 hypothetical protein [Candidatus Wallbacteria bacterium]HPG58422.1 hypothetical protein [Candidatus Wallbacteria bacterium]
MKKKTAAKKMASDMLNDFKNVLPMAGFDVIINEFVKMITAKFEAEMSSTPDGPEKEKQRGIFEKMMADELDGLKSLIASEHSGIGDLIDKESGEIISEVGEYYDESGEFGDEEIDEKTAAEMAEKFKKASRKKMEDELFKPMMEDFKKTFLND